MIELLYILSVIGAMTALLLIGADWFMKLVHKRNSQ